MSLRGIVRALGGDLYQNGYRANIPAPGHGKDDRSVSLFLSEGRVIVHSFGAADWREVLDDLREQGLIDRAACPAGRRSAVGVAAPCPGRLQRTHVARRLWDDGVDMGIGRLATRHLSRRGIGWTEGIRNLREHPAAPLSVYGQGGRTRRAMMARISTPEGQTSAVELTYLAPDGDQASDLRVSRKTVGQMPAGSAVRLSPIAADMLVAEGVVTTLSAMIWFDRPGWALLSVTNLVRWRPPAGVARILIAADRGPAGEAAAGELARSLRTAGLEARVALPPEGLGDWNDALSAAGTITAEREEEGRPGAPTRRG